VKFSKLKKNKWFRIFSNRYFLILTFFVVWMVFFDANSLLVHRELNKEIRDLENSRDYFQNEITKDKEFLEKLQDDEELEKFARETYFLKKENEEIFIIEDDTTKKNKN
jgi:cell division protein DivIC